MTLPMSGNTPLPQSIHQQTPKRGRWLIVFSAVSGSIVLVAAATWLLIMEAVAHLLRPPELDAIPAYRGDVGPFQQAALARMTVIVIVSFLAIMALAVLTIVLGRIARRRSGNQATLAWLEKVSGVCLIVSLVGLATSLALSLSSLPAIASFRLRLPLSINQLLDVVLSRSPEISHALVAIMAAGAMGCFILSGIVAHRGQRWRTPISLAVSALILLLWFASTAWVARFLVGLYLHLVW
ncbi:MAG TPA: hypothetical protein VFS83_18040 [Ktedonobacterales bacterium]|nr:hypothetical protein [Ktedonobacterales bacterium]